MMATTQRNTLKMLLTKSEESFVGGCLSLLGNCKDQVLLAGLNMQAVGDTGM